MWSKLPRHISIHISHNPHKSVYEPLEKWLHNTISAGMAGGFSQDEIIHEDDLLKIMASDEVWVISWCPQTPVGSCEVIAATLERALELANDAE